MLRRILAAIRYFFANSDTNGQPKDYAPQTTRHYFDPTQGDW